MLKGVKELKKRRNNKNLKNKRRKLVLVMQTRKLEYIKHVEVVRK